MKIWDIGYRALEEFKQSLAARSAKNRRQRRKPQRGLRFEALEPRYALSGVSGMVTGVMNGSTHPLPNVSIAIVGRDAQNNVIASASTLTAANGSYSFTNLPAGTYAITETQPAKIANGSVSVGTAGGNPGTNTVTGIVLGNNVNATGYNFNEGGVSVISVNLFLASTPSNGADLLASLVSDGTSDTPEIAITSVTNPLNSSNANSATASGTGEAGALVSVIVTDGSKSSTARTARVATNGTWTVNGINVNQLANGLVNFVATITDSSGQTATSSLQVTKNVADPLIDITSATTPVGLANQNSVSASGTTQIGTTVKVEVTDGTTTTTAVNATVAADGTWTVSGINVSSLKDGSITYRATMTDNNGQTFTDTFAATKATVVITSATNPVGQDDVTNATASGTGQPGATISVIASSGTNSTTARTTTVTAGGTWTVSGINLTGLADGSITYTATATAAGSTDTATFTASKDTVAPALDLVTVTNPIQVNNHFSTTATGTGEAGRTVSVVASDGTTTTTARTATVLAGGTWTVTGIDLSTLKDGTITYTATISDAAGNERSDTLTATKATVKIDSATDLINETNVANATVSGTGQPGLTVSVVATNGSVTSTPRTTTVAANGTWTVTGLNLNQLANGTVTYRATISDGSGNSATATRTATRNVTEPLVDITSASSPITIANQNSVFVSGKAQVGTTLKVEVTDGTTTTTPVTPTLGANGTWSFTGINVSGLKDGTITYRVTMTDSDNHTFTDTFAATKATVLITSATNPITEDVEDNASVQGTGQVGATITVVATDGTNTTAAQTTTVAANGTWSVSGLDLSGLADGTITYRATASDGQGNSDQSELTATKDSVDPALAFTNATAPVALNNYFSASASGTGDAGNTISVVASDGTTTTPARTTTVQPNGTWTVTGIDLSSLKDGTITYTATASDGAGNTATATRTTTKATNEIATITTPLNVGNVKNATISGTGQVGATVTVVITDGTKNTATKSTTVLANGTWSVTGIDASELADGTVTYRATAADGSGNSLLRTLTATKATVRLTSTTSPVTDTNQTNTTASGTGQVGATVSVTVTDGTTTTTAATTTVAANGTWSITGINVSSLLDGTITYTASVTESGTTITSTRTSTKSTAAPVNFAVDDTYNVSIGDTLTTTTANGLLANDTNGATNPVLVSGPAHGSVTINANGTFSYTQTTYGFDQFTYRVTRPGGQTDEATVTLRVPGLPQLPAGAVLTTTASGMQFYDFTVGTGASPTATSNVTVDYVGYLPTGEVFDSNNNINFNLQGVIQGFREGVQGMKVGGQRRIIIPPNIGYGPGGNSGAGIEGDDTIVFDVTLDAVLS